MQHNTLPNIKPIEKSINTLMYVARYAWELGGALVFVVAATLVNRLPTRTSCYFEPECIQIFCSCAHLPPPKKEEEKRKTEEEEGKKSKLYHTINEVIFLHMSYCATIVQLRSQ